MRTRSVVFIFVVVVLIVFGVIFIVDDTKPEVGDDDRLHIVTTFTPLYIFTKNVVQDTALVENLLPSGVGPHDYSFTPSDLVKIARADVVVKQGRGLDDWVDGAIEAAGRNDIRVIVASEGIEPHTGPAAVDISTGAILSTPDDYFLKPVPEDPHLWIDPFLAMREVERIRDGLMMIDGENSLNYAKNAEEYMLRLLALDAEVRQALDILPKRDFVTFHPAFRYFAYEYGLREVAVIEEVPGGEPSPTDLVKLVDDVKSIGVNVIFSEPQFSPKIVQTLAQDYGLRVAELDPMETGELDVGYYELVTRKNVNAIVDSFK